MNEWEKHDRFCCCYKNDTISLFLSSSFPVIIALSSARKYVYKLPHYMQEAEKKLATIVSTSTLYLCARCVMEFPIKY